MSSSDDQQGTRKVITTGCVTCVLALLALIVLVRTVWIPQAIRRERMMSCRSNRRAIGEQETLYKQNSLAHQYTTSLKQLGVPHNCTVCPEDGVYSVVIQNNQAEIRCSIEDHAAVVVK